MTNLPGKRDAQKAATPKRIQDAVTLLVRAAQRGGHQPRQLTWQSRLTELATILRLEDHALRAGVVLPRRERRREIDRLLNRLKTAARKGRLTGKPLAIDPHALADLQLVDPEITEDDVCRPPDLAAAVQRIAAALQKLDDDPDKPIYGVERGGLDADMPARSAIAGVCDVVREAGAGLTADRNELLDQVVGAVAQAAGASVPRMRRHIPAVLATLECDAEPSVQPRRNRGSGA